MFKRPRNITQLLLTWAEVYLNSVKLSITSLMIWLTLIVPFLLVGFLLSRLKVQRIVN